MQCLEYDLATQARTLKQLYKSLHRVILGHVALRIRHQQRPFEGLPSAPKKYWQMFERSKIEIPPAVFQFGRVAAAGVGVRPPAVRLVAPPNAA